MESKITVKNRKGNRSLYQVNILTSQTATKLAVAQNDPECSGKFTGLYEEGKKDFPQSVKGEGSFVQGGHTLTPRLMRGKRRSHKGSKEERSCNGDLVAGEKKRKSSL